MPRTDVRATLAALLIAALALLPLPAAAAPSTLTARFEFSADTATASGTLTSGGQALVGQRVVATIDGAPQAEETTNSSGDFTVTFRLPRDLAAGPHEIAVVFAGSDGADPARTAATFTVEADSEDPEPSEPQPAPATLTATAPKEGVNGTLIAISGRLVTTGGVGVAKVGISVSDASGEVDDSYTLTGADGTFTTLYAIPEEQPSGPMTLTVSFAGEAGIAAAAAEVTLTVEYTEAPTASPSPSPTEASPTPSPTPTPSVTASPSPAATAGETTKSLDADSPVTWFLAAALAVGGVALLTTVVLVHRGLSGRGQLDGEERSLSFLDED